MTCPKGCCPDVLTHYRSINISADALPTRGKPVSAISAKEKRWGKDMDAYKRLRRDRIQPQQIDGCAEFEQRAESRIEIESKIMLDSKQRQACEDIMDYSEGTLVDHVD